jgi:hypothetical protein
MTDDVSKPGLSRGDRAASALALPAFPLEFRPTMENQLGWLKRDRDAYRARMEALKQYAGHMGVWCSQDSGHACTCGLDALLAACVRRSEG